MSNSLSQSARRRVVITSLGLVSPLGCTPDSLWAALSAGTSGIGPVAMQPPDALPVEFVAEAREFTGSIDNFGPLEGELKKSIRKGLKVMCRETEMGIAAAQRALHAAGYAPGAFDPERCGVEFGSDYMMTMPDEFSVSIAACIDDRGRFDFSRWATEGLTRMFPLWLLKYLPNMPASHIAIFNDLRGPNNSLTLREASANLAIGEAYRIVCRDHADLMVAGATGTRIHPMKAVHASLQEEVVLNSAAGLAGPAASRPFDLRRAGMVLGEGAGVVTLESLATARARGAAPLAEIVGAGSSSAADRSGLARRDVALANAMRAALRDAGMAPDEVGHVNAHGLSTRTCDEEEAKAIRAVFGERRVPVTAAKSYFGNLGAGSGAVELIASVLSLLHDELFPTLNYETPDPACPVAVVVERGTKPGDSFLTIGVTPQGQASCLAIKRYRD